jgi:hypothetical protein
MVIIILYRKNVVSHFEFRTSNFLKIDKANPLWGTNSGFLEA